MVTGPNTYTFSLSLEPSDLAEATFPLRELSETLNDLLHILSQIEANVAPGSHVTWELDGDPEIKLRANVNGVSAETLDAIVGEAREGFRATATPREAFPKGIEPKTRRRLRSVITRLTNIAPLMVEAINRDPIVIDRQQPLAAPSIARPLSVERSEIDGALDVISVRGRPHFVLFEHGTNQRVNCVLPDELMPRVKEALGRRVVVEGMVRYRVNGRPLSVTDVTTFTILPDPTLSEDDLAGAIPNISGDLPTGEFVYQARRSDAPDA
jgi:hypothetical protein